MKLSANLSFAQKANTKKSAPRAKFPLRYGVKPQRFFLSDAAFAQLNLKERALTCARDTDTNVVYFFTVPAELAAVHKAVLRGRKGKEKGQSFKASEYRAILNAAGMTGNTFSFEEAGTVEDAPELIAYKLVPMEISKEEEAEISAEEEAEAEVEPADEVDAAGI